MALLRKDLKIGFLAGAVLLVLGVGYALFSTLRGPDDALAAGSAAGGDPLAAAPAETAAGTIGGESAAGDGGNPPRDSDEWAGAYPGANLGQRPPIVTQIPPSGSSGQGGDAVPASAAERDVTAQIPNVNDNQFPAGPNAGGPSLGAGSVLNLAGNPSVNAVGKAHVVQSGENFSTLAKKYYGDGALFDFIAKANPSVDPRRLKIGQKLSIPDLAEAQKAAAPAPPSVPAAGNVAATNGDAGVGTYTVSTGDTLSSIAEKRLGRRALWKQIYDLNRDAIGGDPAALKVGMTLKLPT